MAGLARFLKDGSTPGTALTFSEFLNVIPRAGKLLEKVDGEEKIALLNDSIISINNLGYRSFATDGDVSVGVDDLDVGSALEVGVDYYVYLCDNGANGVLLISKASTFPDGYSAESSRKIGGFHYGHVRATNSLWIPVDSAGAEFGSGGTAWEENVSIGIIPNSVWDLTHRPRCSPEGMVQVSDNLWVDIYQSSAAEAISLEGAGLHVSAGVLQSAYGQNPVTGTEGLNWYNMGELAGRVGKRLLSYSEWTQAAFGNPEGEDGADNYGWTKTTNTGRTRTGCRVNASTGAYDGVSGIKPYAVSAYNIVDAVGNVYEWLKDLIQRDGETFSWRDNAGSNKGQIYSGSANSPAVIIAGGDWNDGVNAGARALNAGNQPWNVNTSNGVRLACDSL